VNTTNRVCELAHIDVPVLQAPMTYIAGARLAAAVSPAAEKLDAATSPAEGGAALQRVQRLYFDGDMDASVANTGQVAGRIDDLAPAADIIAGMWVGCRAVLAATADRLGPAEPGRARR
jgi:enoyl-[acyl-carrier protein] reductase II